MNMIRDSLSGLGVILDALHYLVHLGKLYNLHADVVDTSFDTGVTLDILLVTGAAPVHAFMEAQAFGGRAEFDVIEDVTATASATAVTPSNANREAPSDASVKFVATLAPTSVSGGTSILHRQIFASSSASSKTGASLRTGEILLARNKKYLIRMTSKTDNMLGAIDLELYER